MNHFLAAVVQMNASASKEENLARVAAWTAEAAAAGARLVALPEVFF
ncbi:MAG: hypothetical protein KC466_21075, partial [Myxococcales bacterium]|nr:hypothetical protein [Myxococcales bacterium]